MDLSWEKEIEEYERKNRENLQRMVNDKRINIIRGRKPVRQPPESREKKQVGEPRNKISSATLRDTIFRFHEQSSTKKEPINGARKLHSGEAIRDMVSQVSFSKNRLISHVTNNLFLYIMAVLLSRANTLVHGCDPEVINFVRTLRQTLNWFVDNKFTYIVPPRNERSQTIKKSRPLKRNIGSTVGPKGSIISTLKNIKYKRMDMRIDLPEPTHVIIDFRSIGKFLLLVQVKSLASKELKTVLLMRNDMTMDFRVDDSLVLPNSSKTYYTINGEELPVFISFHYIKS